MTKVVCITKNNKLSLIRIEGHAAYARKGSDIVCAGISSVVEGAQSFFKIRYCKEIFIDRNKLGTTFFVTNHSSDKILQSCLQMFIHQLRNISYFYPNYITIHFE